MTTVPVSTVPSIAVPTMTVPTMTVPATAHVHLAPETDASAHETANVMIVTSEGQDQAVVEITQVGGRDQAIATTHAKDQDQTVAIIHDTTAPTVETGHIELTTENKHGSPIYLSCLTANYTNANDPKSQSF